MNSFPVEIIAVISHVEDTAQQTINTSSLLCKTEKLNGFGHAYYQGTKYSIYNTKSEKIRSCTYLITERTVIFTEYRYHNGEPQFPTLQQVEFIQPNFLSQVETILKRMLS